MAKCWDPTPRGYFTLPRHEQARPVDPLSWLAHTQAVQNTYQNPQQQILLHNRPSHTEFNNKYELDDIECKQYYG